MRLTIGVLVAFFALTGFAVAAGDPFANYYDNTVVVANAKGERSVLINKDGSYSQKLPDGTSAAGKWALDGDKGCFTADNPAPDAKPYCVAAVPHNVGDSWDLTAPDGTAEKATLKAGR
jgi:hypothetical protein